MPHYRVFDPNDRTPWTDDQLQEQVQALLTNLEQAVAQRLRHRNGMAVQLTRDDDLLLHDGVLTLRTAIEQADPCMRARMDMSSGSWLDALLVAWARVKDDPPPPEVP